MIKPFFVSLFVAIKKKQHKTKQLLHRLDLI